MSNLGLFKEVVIFDHAEEFAMRRQPDDTITVTLSDDNQSTTIFGDPGFPINGRGRER